MWNLPDFEIMPINIRLIIIKISIWFSGGRYSHRDMSMVSCQKSPTGHAYAWRIGPFWQDTLDVENDWSATTWHLKSPAPCPWYQQSYPGVARASVEDDYMKGDSALLCIIKGNRFISVSRIRMRFIRQIICYIFVCMVTSGWVSLKTSRHIPQTDIWSSPPVTHICTPSPELESSALISCDIYCWGQGQPLPLWSTGFSDATFHQPFNIRKKHSGMSFPFYTCRSWPWTHQQISAKISVGGSSLMPLCQNAVALMMIRS